jgi:uncharacterized DUF497 family protein
MEFEWDKGNIDKSFKRHNVSDREAEEVFSDFNKAKYPDPKHSNTESRYILTGQTQQKRQLLVIYTIRKNYIRIISARDLNKRKEGHLYEKAFNTTKI